MKNKINVIVVDIPFHEGMAGTKRVRNLMMPLYNTDRIKISNLILITVYEKELIGTEGAADGIDYRYIGYSGMKNLMSVFKFYSAGKNFINKHTVSGSKNILYYYGYPDLKNFYFIVYAKLKGFKIIFDIVEDNRHSSDFHGLAGRIRNSTSIFLLKKVKYFGDGVIVISKHLEKWLIDLKVDKLKVYNIPITVDTTTFDSMTMSKNNDGIVKIFYGGSFASKDGLEFLLEAFESVCKVFLNIKLILTGAGQPTHMEKINEKIKANNKIEYLGFLTTEDYFTVLQDVDICCMTRNNSLFANAGFPFKLGEFLAAGKAIVATTVGDIPYYLTDKLNALLVLPESSSEIAKALSTLIRNEEDIRYCLGVEAKKIANKYFNDKVLSEKLYTIFEEI